MKYLVCSADWDLSNNVPYCTGTLQQVDEQNSSALSLEEATELKNYALELFAVVACFLLIKRALF